jgi:enoyl-[acyl-carrier protein] reductase I
MTTATDIRRRRQGIRLDPSPSRHTIPIRFRSSSDDDDDKKNKLPVDKSKIHERKTKKRPILEYEDYDAIDWKQYDRDDVLDEDDDEEEQDREKKYDFNKFKPPSQKEIALHNINMDIEEPNQPKDRRVALIIGVSPPPSPSQHTQNRQEDLDYENSLVWAIAKNFLMNGYHCIVTYDSNSQKNTVETIIDKLADELSGLNMNCTERGFTTDGKEIELPGYEEPKIAGVQCNILADLPMLFSERIPEILQTMDDRPKSPTEKHKKQLQTIVHCVSYPHTHLPNHLLETSFQEYKYAQHVSAYSLLEIAREATWNRCLISDADAAITTLSFLGATRAIPEYTTMGSVMAAVEAIVRGLSLELGPKIRINAVSTALMAKTTTTFTTTLDDHPEDLLLLQKHFQLNAPLQRSSDLWEIAETVRWLSSSATAITGQTIPVDCGYSSVVPHVIDVDGSDNKTES